MREDGKVHQVLSSSEVYQGVRGQQQVSSWKLSEGGLLRLRGTWEMKVSWLHSFTPSFTFERILLASLMLTDIESWLVCLKSGTKV